MPYKPRPSYQHLLSGAFLLLLFYTYAPSVVAQTSEPQRGFSPAGSYALSDLEVINVANGNLMLNFPFGKLPAGRGGMSGQIGLHYNSKLFDGRAANFLDHRPSGSVTVPGQALSRSDEGGWHYGIYYWWELIDRNVEDAVTYEYPDNQAKFKYKVKLHFPDGSAHEFTPQADASHQLLNDGYWNLRPDGYYTDWSGGGCYPANCVYPHDYLYYTGTMVYYSTDGTYLRLEFQHDADDYNPYNNPWALYMPDGTQLTNGIPRPNGDCGFQCIYDRNENYIEIREITYNGHFTYQLRDQLGRDVKLELGSAPGEDAFHVTGFGATLDYRVKWKTLYVGRQYQPSWECLSCPQTIGLLSVVSEINLPTQAGNLKYTFGYNAPDYAGSPPPSGWSVGWGELSSVTLPSGAQVKYQYRQDNSTELIMTEDALKNSAAQKDLIYRPEYDLAGPVSNTPCASQSETCVTETWTYDFGNGFGGSVHGPDGSTSSESLDDYQRVFWIGRPDGTVVERRWLQNMPPGYAPPLIQHEGVNGYVKTEYTSIKDAAGSLVKTAIKDYAYDKNGNVTRVDEYDWVPYVSVPRDGNARPTGLPANPQQYLARSTLTNFYAQTPDAADSTTTSGNIYTDAAAPRLRSVVQAAEVRTSGGQVASRAEFYYDDPYARGNLTERRSWDSTKGGYSNPLGTGNSVSSFQQYGAYGNPTLATDAKGNQTLLIYGSVNGYTDLYPTETRSAYQTTLELVTTQAFDFNTGLVTQATDPNGVATETGYDAFGRPTLVKAAVGRAEETRVQTEYSDVNRRVIVRRDLSSVGDGKLVSIQHYDQLGRVRLTRQLEDAATQSATDETTGVKVQTRYLFNGQNSYQLASNPYRAAYAYQATSEPTVGWARTKADNSGRVMEVQNFAGASLPAPWDANTSSTGAVTTAYDGIYTTVTDQVGKLRRSMVNGLGQLVRVDEPDANNNLGMTTAPVQPTAYTYDALSNLTQVVQGTQTRTFQYSSLARLTSATNPESGTISYQYDANGNLETKTDARGWTSTYTYDALNRNATVDYSNTTTNPDINRYYDNPSPYAGYTKGRYWFDEYHRSDGSIEQQAIDAYDALGRPWVHRQVFYTGGQWHHYETRRNFDRAGHVTWQQYPSGHSVNYNYDAAGRLGDNGASLAFTGNLGDGTTRTYAQGLSYDAASRMQAERFGTTTPLYHKLHYNVRGQLYDIRLSTQSLTTGEWDWNRGALINYYSQNEITAAGNAARALSGPANNGNVLRGEVWIPTNPNASYDGISGAGAYAMAQERYGYDALNRLTSVSEYQNGQSQVFAQAYDYDRFGNRTINQTQSWGTGIPEPVFDLDAATNRLYAAGDMGITDPNQRAMRYDAAGNVTYDNYSPQTQWGWRKYDAENRLTEQDTTVDGQWVSKYAYDADGHRVRRNIGGQTTWQVYGLDGELVAEYGAGASAANPQKEYGYRNGELLVTAAMPVPGAKLAVAAATASNSTPDTTPALATDGNPNTAWNAGGFAPQWLQLDLGQATTITRVRLRVAQSPAGTTVHQVWGGATTGSLGLLGTLAGTTQDGQWIELSAPAVNVRYVKVLTTQSPSWVAWSEVEVYGTGGARTNFAAAANGGVATASSTYGPYVAAYANDGYRTSVDSRIWLDGTLSSFPDSLQIEFGGPRTIDEIDVVTQQDNYANPVEPTEALTFTQYGVMAFTMQYWDGTSASWVTIPGGSVTGNNKVWRKFTFPAVTTTKIQVTVNAGSDNAFSRLVEVETWSAAQGGGQADIEWLVSDHLGTPRMMVDETGSLSSIKRHDYLPFGEEIGAGVGGRTTQQGYVPDNVRQGFGKYEKDSETGLDYAQARYYANAQGRFTSVDPLMESIRPSNPQTMNRYTFVLNNPLRYVDPNGLKEKTAWEQLTDEDRKVLASKLVTVNDPNKLTKAELKSAGDTFNKLIGTGSAKEISERVLTAQNFIDTVGGRENSAVWQQLDSIQGIGNISVTVDVKNKGEFLGALQSSGFVVNDFVGETIANTHPNDSARQIVEQSTDPPLHFANDDSSKANRFVGHWDPTSAYFRTQTWHADGVSDWYMRQQERIWAAQQHGVRPVSALDVYKYIHRNSGGSW